MNLPLSSLAGGADGAISDADFALFQRLIVRHCGIRLNNTKKALLVGRLWKRIHALGLSSFRAYYTRVKDDAGEQVEMIDLITTNETSFFRERKQFALLEEEIVPSWILAAETARRPKHLRVWSAGCSTGEEPYSVAAVLATLCPGWNIDIVATDISTRALRVAEKGIWPAAKGSRIPPRYLTRHFLEGVGANKGTIKAKVSLARHIRFERLNLQDRDDHIDGPFDLILCRNVLIYFETEARERIVESLFQRLQIGGYLFLGHSETLSAQRWPARSVASAVWVRR